MLNRRLFVATALAAPAIVSQGVLGQALRKVKLGSAFTTTTNAMFLMPDLLKPEGIDAELVTFPSLVQRMQAVASGAVDVGNGGLSATMQLATKGFPMAVLANGCDGGWMLVAKPSVTSFAQLAGKKIGVQNGSIGLVSLNWKLRAEKLDGKVELVFLDNQDQPTPLARGDLDAICCFEPYAAFAELSGFGHKLWVPVRHADGQDQPRLRRQRAVPEEGAGADAQAGGGAREGDRPDEERAGDRDRDHDQAVQHEPGDRRGVDRRTCSTAPRAARPSRPG